MNPSTKVLESRRSDDGLTMRRRRECPACGRRFTTFERREREPVFVRKRGGERERFDPVKARSGMERASHKRPVEPADLDRVIRRIEIEAESLGGEIPAQRVGELCLEGLRALDRVAYLQFAAVYRGFTDPSEFEAELRGLGIDHVEAGQGGPAPGHRSRKVGTPA